MSDLRARAAGNDVARRNGPDDARASIRAMQDQFQLAMPKGAEAAQLVRDAMTVLSASPGLASVDRTSFLGGLMTCAQLGLRPGVLGQAWLIPFKGRAQLIVGYQGLLVLAQRSGDIASIQARMVHKADLLVVEYGLDEKLVHRPVLDADRGPVVGYYCVVKTKSGGVYWEYLSQADAVTHRDRFAMAKSGGQVVGPWRDHFDAMALKTVIIRTLKLAPRDTRLQQAIDVDGSVRMNVEPTAVPEEVSAVPVTEVDVPAEIEEATPEAVPVVEVEEDPGISAAQLKRLGAVMGGLGLKDRSDALRVASRVVGRDIGSRNDLTRAEARVLIDTLEAEGAAGLVAEVLGAGVVEDPPGEFDPTTEPGWTGTEGDVR
jgi:recombination protein RecT